MRRFPLPFCLALLTACPADPPPGGAGSDVADLGDATDASETADTPDASGDTGDADAGPTAAPVKPFVEPAPVDVEQWLVTFVSGGDDPVLTGLELGSFVMPEGPGPDVYGIDWTVRVPDADGKLGSAGSGLLYAALSLDVDAPTGLVVQADRVHRTYVDGAPQPGDVYASGKLRAPFHLEAGTHQIVVRALGGPNEPRVNLWTTDDELHLNVDDLTAPHLLVGRDDTQFVGLPVLNLTDRAVTGVTTRVVGSEHFEEATRTFPALGPGTATQLAFELRPRAPWEDAPDGVPVTVRVESPDLEWSYERELTLQTRLPSEPYRRTFVSRIDGSVQYYGVREPTDPGAAESYALILSLHGASVQGLNQAKSYSPKPWAYLAAPTNRRPFGFDWEVWGRLDALEVLRHAKDSFPTDPTRVYLTGHSMGGHGTWQLGVLFPGEFAVVGPSAGWSSFYSYGGDPRPSGAFARSRASSDTLNYVSNLARRAVYVIHGTADDNVPISEANLMIDAVSQHTDDIDWHFEEGAGHWWNGDASEGADCVDWPPLMELMQARTLDPSELDFAFTTPSPWVSPTHSFVTIRSCASAWADCSVTSESAGDAVTLTTTNVRSMVLDGDALSAKAVITVTVDGTDHAVAAGPIEVGPQDGKRPGVHGPFNEVMHAPFCFVVPDAPRDGLAEYAAYLVSTWSFIGNGQACMLPVSALTDDVRAERNLIYVGVPKGDIAGGEAIPFDWDETTLDLGAHAFVKAAVAFVYPIDGRLTGVMTATRYFEYLLPRLQPFTSRTVVPDFLAWGEGGGLAAGFFEPDWSAAEPAP